VLLEANGGLAAEAREGEGMGFDLGGRLDLERTRAIAARLEIS
jgi:hypothetical protein